MKKRLVQEPLSFIDRTGRSHHTGDGNHVGMVSPASGCAEDHRRPALSNGSEIGGGDCELMVMGRSPLKVVSLIRHRSDVRWTDFHVEGMTVIGPDLTRHACTRGCRSATRTITAR